MTPVVKDGVYESRSHGQGWPVNRRVYIQNGSVRLVNYFSESDPLPERISVFSYKGFFEVNVLGPRVSDLPKDFNIRE